MTIEPKPIQGYENYLIYPDGRVYHKSSGEFIIGGMAGKDRNYRQVSLFNNGVRKASRVGRLVALHFVPNPSNLETVDHIDGDTTNNNYTNLQWLSRGDNVRKARKMMSKEQKKSSYKVSDVARQNSVKARTDHTVYRFVHKDGIVEEMIQKEFIKKYGLTQANVNAVVKGRRKSHKGWSMLKED